MGNWLHQVRLNLTDYRQTPTDYDRVSYPKKLSQR
jgi:hypothetical protein